MSTQIFKNPVPTEWLFDILNNLTTKNEKYFTFNNNAYKKGVFNNMIAGFLEKCIPFYHLSKRKYVECKLTYNSFTTILRQICKCNNIKYTSVIKYDKSNYDIIYYIYF